MYSGTADPVLHCTVLYSGTVILYTGPALWRSPRPPPGTLGVKTVEAGFLSYVVIDEGLTN